MILSASNILSSDDAVTKSTRTFDEELPVSLNEKLEELISEDLQSVISESKSTEDGGALDKKPDDRLEAEEGEIIDTPPPLPLPNLPQSVRSNFLN